MIGKIGRWAIASKLSGFTWSARATRRNSVNDFLAEDRGRRAKESLVGLLLVMFPNTPDDVDDSDD